jgi:hypothetical protein
MPKRWKVPGYRNLYRIEGSQKIYLIDSYPGLGEVVRSTRQSDVAIAAKKAKELEREILKLDPNYKPVTVAEVAKEYMTVMEQEWRESTTDTARSVIENRIIRYLGDVRLDGPLRGRWADFAKKFYAGELDLSTEKTRRRSGTRHKPSRCLFNTRKAFIGILNYAREEGYVTRLGSEPTGRGKRRKRKLFPINDPKPREGLFIPREHLDLLMTAPTRKPTIFTFELVCRIGYFMGCRLWEMLGLYKARVDLEKPSFLFRPEDVKTGSITGEGREIAIAPEVIGPLRRWLQMNQSPCVFPARGVPGPMDEDGFRTIWRRAVARIRRALEAEQKARMELALGDVPRCFTCDVVMLGTTPTCPECGARWVTELQHAIGEGTATPFELALDRALRNPALGDTFPDYNPNDLRHTFFTTKLLIENKNIVATAIYGGTSVEMLQERYIHDKYKNTKGVVERPARGVHSDPNTGILPGLETYWSESDLFASESLTGRASSGASESVGKSTLGGGLCN